MAEIVIPGPISGRNYGFVISGDRPTVDEQMRIDAALNQYESQFADEYEARRGIRPAGAENDILDYLGEFPKGIARGGVGFGETAALGIASLLPEEYESPVREFIRRSAYNLKPQADIGMEETVSGQFGEALGSFGALGATTLLPGGALLAPTLAVGAGAGEASERARAAGATQEERNQTLLPGAVVGAAELLPIKFMKALGRGDTLSLTQRISRIAQSAGVEGAQEAAAQAAQNLIARGIYDPDQGVFTGTGESLGYGAGVGGLVQGLLDLAVPGRRRTAAGPVEETEGVEEAEATPAPEEPARPAPSAAAPQMAEPDLEDVPDASQFELPDPLGDITSSTLDELRVSKETPVRKRIESGKYETKAAVLDALEEYASFVKKNPEKRAIGNRVQAFVNTARMAERDRQRAAAQQPREPEDVTAGDGVPSAGEQRAPESTGAAEAPDVRGLAVPAESVGDAAVAEGTQQTALEGMETGETVTDEPVSQAEAEEKAEAPVEDVSTAEVEETAVSEEPTLPEPETAQQEEQAVAPPATDEGLTTTPTEADAAVARYDALSEQEKNDLAEAAEIPREGNQLVSAILDDPAGYTRLMDLLAEPEPAPSQVQIPARNVIPGRTTGAAGQTIPAGIAGVRTARPTVTANEATGLDRDIERMVEQRMSQLDEVSRRRNAQLRSEILDVWRENSSPEMQRAVLDMVDPTPDVTTALDKQKIIDLIKKKGRGKRTDPEFAARLYFTKNPDPMTAIDTIAYDSVSRTDAFFRTTSDAAADMNPGELEYYKQTGRDSSKAAVRWIRDNLSSNAGELLRSRQRFYFPKSKKAVQAEINARDKAQQYQRDVQQWIDDTMGPAEKKGPSLPDAVFSPTVALDMPLHPRVVRAIERGDINAALDGIIATAGSADASRLAAKLRPFIQNTRMMIASPQLMRDAAEAFGTLGVDTPYGMYIPVASEQRLQAVAEYAPERAALYRQYSGRMLFNSDNGLTASTFLHEAVHAATMETLLNEAHPLTRQVESLLAKARQIIPEGYDGLLDRYEFVSEALTNKDFIQELAQVDVGLGNDKFTLRQRLMNALRNFGRQLIGRKAKPLQSAKDQLDQMLDDILAPNIDARGVGTLYEAAFRTGGYRDKMNSMSKRVVEATPQNTQELRRMARRGFKSGALISARNFAIRSSMPLQYVVMNAKRYLPSAERLYDVINMHEGARRKHTELVDETMEAIEPAFKNNPQRVRDFNQITNEGTRFEVDVRKPEKFYSEFRLTYKIVDDDGDVVESKFEGFPARDDMIARINELNANPPADRTDARTAYDPTTEANVERLQKYRELKRIYESASFGPQGRSAVNRAFELPEKFRKEIQDVFLKRLESIPEAQRTANERVFQKIFSKLFADKLIDPFRALQRTGDYGLSYVANDPDTGKPEVFKHFFPSDSARSMAIRYLTEEAAISPASGIDVTSIQPYDADSTPVAQQRPSMEFILSFLNKVEGSEVLSNTNVREEFLNLVYESMPETSFVKMFQKRKGVRGFDLDITPLEEVLQLADSASDTVANLKRSGMRMANQLANIEYRTNIDALRRALNEEYKLFVEERNMQVADPLERAGNQNEAKMYLDVLNDHAGMATYRRANWSRNLNAVGYTMFLGLNVSTAALTLFQITNFLGPMLMPKYGSRNATAAFGAASRLLGQSAGTRTTSRISADGGIERFDKKIPFYDMSLSNRDYALPENQWLKPLFEAGDAFGGFTRSAAQEHIDATSAKGLTQKVAAWSGLLQHHLERYVRETTMGSTYMLELYKNMPEGKAVSFNQFQTKLRDGTIEVPADVGKAAAIEAMKMTDMVNGSIYAATAPLFSQGNIGSNLYLFKRFPLSMLNLLGHTLKEALRGERPEVRRVAAMQFAAMTGSLGMLSGIAGVPGFYTAAAIYNFFKDDEDEDLETLIRTGVLGERGLTGLVDYYTGLSVSSRLGLSGVFYRPGFSTEGQPTLMTIAEAMGGPLVGLFTKYTDRVPYFFNQGEYWRATEAALPTALANAMKSMRFATEGARTLRHDPIVDEIGPFGVGAQFFGFMPKEYARQLAENNYQRKLDNSINRKRTNLLKKLNHAQRYGVPDQAAEALREIQEFNARFPFAAITSDTMDRSYRAFQQTTSRMHHGITYSRKNEPLLRQSAADFDNAPATAYSR